MLRGSALLFERLDSFCRNSCGRYGFKTVDSAHEGDCIKQEVFSSPVAFEIEALTLASVPRTVSKTKESNMLSQIVLSEFSV